MKDAIDSKEVGHCQSAIICILALITCAILTTCKLLY